MDDDLETLRRWEDFGAVWEVVIRTPEQVTLSLLRCDGGEEVGRLVSADPELLAHVDDALAAAERSAGADVAAAEADDSGGQQRQGHQG